MSRLNHYEADLVNQIPLFLVIFVSGIVFGALLLLGSIRIIKILAYSVDEQQEIPQPSFGKAIKIILLATVVSPVLYIPIGMLVSVLDSTINPAESFAIFVVKLFFYPTSFVVFAVILKTLLPTTFGRASTILVFLQLLAIFCGVVLVVAVSILYLVINLLI